MDRAEIWAKLKQEVSAIGPKSREYVAENWFRLKQKLREIRAKRRQLLLDLVGYSVVIAACAGVMFIFQWLAGGVSGVGDAIALGLLPFVVIGVVWMARIVYGIEKGKRGFQKAMEHKWLYGQCPRCGSTWDPYPRMKSQLLCYTCFCTQRIQNPDNYHDEATNAPLPDGFDRDNLDYYQSDDWLRLIGLLPDTNPPRHGHCPRCRTAMNPYPGEKSTVLCYKCFRIQRRPRNCHSVPSTAPLPAGFDVAMLDYYQTDVWLLEIGLLPDPLGVPPEIAFPSPTTEGRAAKKRKKRRDRRE